MPSFLNKVFSRKKDEKDTGRSSKRTSVQSLLEGKFEAVSPTVSPSATDFLEAGQSRDAEKERTKEKEKEKEKEGGFGLFKVKSRTSESKSESSKGAVDVPHLTLNLPVPKEKETRALGVVFEADPEDRSTLPDNIIGERRLSPLETLLLVKACSAAIIERGGLETLGVMHPHWYSASPDVQKRLISLFILSLSPKSPITTLSPTPASPQVIFNTELEYTRSPHDIAAVLRWALRHLRLEGDSFGRSEGAPWQWYTQFVNAERTAAYPANAYSSILVPELPLAHLQLLSAILEIVSSLAAHSERNSVSGSKLTKLLGLWLIMARRAEAEDDWAAFYAKWERAGRALEHIFLAEIRDEMARKKMPLRLAELVHGYPYTKDGSSVESDTFPRPRFSSRRVDALFVRIETRLPDHTTPKPAKQHPLRLIADALKAEASAGTDSFQPLWEIIKKAAAASEEGEAVLTPETEQEESYPTLSRIFADETIRMLSLIPAEHSGPSSPTFQLPASPTIRLSRPAGRRSSSLGHAHNGASANGKASEHEKSASSPPVSPKDWSDFSSAGFGESTLGNDFAKTLLDNDLEVTTPRPVQRKTSRGRRRGSLERGREPLALQPVAPSSRTMKSTAARVEPLKLDEAFVDFWSDALLDPISADWPSFVVAQLKPHEGLALDGKPVNWLVVEQTFTRPPPPPEPEAPARASSPRPSMRSNTSASRKSATFSAARKRFTFFSASSSTISAAERSPTSARKSGVPARISEMGEVLPEEEGKSPVETIPPVPAIPAAALASAAAAADTTPTSDADELPAVPVVETEEPAPAPEAVVAVEPIKTEEMPVEKSTMSVPENVEVPADAPQSQTQVASEEKVLPPAPEPIVLTGETPGPQVALDTSEPAALAEAATRAQEEPAHQQAAEPTQETATNNPEAEVAAAPDPVVEYITAQEREVAELAPAPELKSVESEPADEPAASEVAVTEAAHVGEVIQDTVAAPAHNPQDTLPEEPEQEATEPTPTQEPQPDDADAHDNAVAAEGIPEVTHENGSVEDAVAKVAAQSTSPETAE